MDKQQYINAINTQRKLFGFLSVDETLALSRRDNIILDVFSTLISESCIIGHKNTFYPNVIIQCANEGILEIKNNNVFFPSCLLIADQGKISIGNNNQFGDGGCNVKANRVEALITIGDKGRYINGPTIIGKTTLGSGSQIIGPVTVQDCLLEEGADFSAQNPDQQAAVLKGSGLARGIKVGKGQVINGQGIFDQQMIENQISYHRK